MDLLKSLKEYEKLRKWRITYFRYWKIIEFVYWVKTGKLLPELPRTDREKSLIEIKKMLKELDQG